MYIVLTLMVIVVVSTITAGFILKNKEDKNKKKSKKLIRINLISYVPLAAAAVILMIPGVSHAAGNTANDPSGLGFIAAALSTGLATIGAGLAVGSVGSSALGAVSEEPGMLGKSLIFVGLAEGIAIYGLIIAIMILGRI